MKRFEQMELILLPIEQGLIKIYVYGFNSKGAWGRVYAELNESNISIKGYHRKKTIIKALSKLNEKLLNKADS
ncbi:hypothetical protein [Falsibacillus albus]|uniref:WGR domain-containing protein n=1 Tax=Falsibacillus albus TaxID=2478915 RepID=A0A3L7JPX3_9BACI|nr:hypothetical protein [Falsibacillus albus]RLQ90602.1 hypothetical protein D9X91_21725 [Falsibacillus albus]